MDDSEKTLTYLVAVETLAENILADKQTLIFLDKRRNENREAMRAIQHSVVTKSKKCWLTIGSNLFKCPTEKALEMIDKDQKQIEIDINKLRSELKVKVNKLRDLEHEPPALGLMLAPLSRQESEALRGGPNYV